MGRGSRFLLLICVFLIACKSQDPGTSPEVKVGNRVGNLGADFTLTARDGSEVKFSDLRGKVLFINFWATWCGPCRFEMPSMEKLHQSMKGKDFLILAVSVDDSGWQAIDPFVQEMKLNFKVLWDRDQKVAAKYSSFRFPETFIVDKDGKILDKRVGPAPWDHAKYVTYFTNLADKPYSP